MNLFDSIEVKQAKGFIYKRRNYAVNCECTESIFWWRAISMSGACVLHRVLASS